MNIRDFDTSTVYTRDDGSFVINKGLYHVPNEGEYTDLWKQINSYVKSHPDIVQTEPVHIFTEKDYMEQEIDGLQYYLSSTDWYVVRYADSGEPIPDAVKVKRAKARLKISELRDMVSRLSHNSDKRP